MTDSPPGEARRLAQQGQPAAAVVAVLAALDTKAAEAQFVAGGIRAAGLTPLLVDLRLRGAASPANPSPAGLSPHEVAAAAGYPSGLPANLPKTEVMELVARGTGALLRAQVQAGQLAGVIGLGGGTGTWLVARAVAGLPLGFPKMLVTTVAGHLSADVLAGTDVVVVPAITDIAGLNPILRRGLANAAAAISAMARLDARRPDALSADPHGARPADPSGARPQPATRGLIGMTMFGVTTAGGTVARERLEAAGYDVAVFHANGEGGRTLERLAAEGAFTAVLDWTTTELIDELAGGRCSAGPGRLEAAGAAGLPQVVVPGAIDVINAGDPRRLPEQFRGRLMHLHRADSALIRSATAENLAAGRIIGTKLSAARGPVRVLIPAGGFSSLDAAGGPFRDQAADDSFVAGLCETAGSRVVIGISPDHINDPPFATWCAEQLLADICALTREHGTSPDPGRHEPPPRSQPESR